MATEYLLPKKLIETGIPLKDINEASAREKSIRHGHPSTLHLWWARRPLATARAVLFSQLVNDPESVWQLQHPGETPSSAQTGAFTRRRNELFALIKKLVQWENTSNAQVMKAAHEEIVRSWKETCELNAGHPDAARLFNPERLPALHDPFAGGGTIPLEAQRLGLRALASDLNPIPVLINKAQIEIPALFSNRAPVGPADQPDHALPLGQVWTGTAGLAEDVRRYARVMREMAQARIGHLYPKRRVTPEEVALRPELRPYLGRELTVIAWIWARTVPSPNPLYRNAPVPLVSTYVLSTKNGNEMVLEPEVKGTNWRFRIVHRKPQKGDEMGNKIGSRVTGFSCLLSGDVIPINEIRNYGKKGKLGAEMIAVVCEGDRERVYLESDESQKRAAAMAHPTWYPDLELPGDTTFFKTTNYGIMRYGDLFSPRQLCALNCFCDLIDEIRPQIRQDAIAAGWEDDGTPLEQGGSGPQAYANAIATYLSIGISKVADRGSSICTWQNTALKIRNTFGRQAISMSWDYCEANPFSESSGNFEDAEIAVSESIEVADNVTGVYDGDIQHCLSSQVIQKDAQTQQISKDHFVSTDPPYYDNIDYADLSDFFYVWQRHSLSRIYPTLLRAEQTPKDQELIASQYRQGGKGKAELYFMDGMRGVLKSLSQQVHPGAPATIYYAFKESETKGKATASSGWETFLEAVVKSGFEVTATWPVRSERGGRMIAVGKKTVTDEGAEDNNKNTLASCVVLAVRPRSPRAKSCGWNQLQNELKTELPRAVERILHGAGEEEAPVSATDLSQAIIGPGMMIYSKYRQITDNEGEEIPIRTVLQAINRYATQSNIDGESQCCRQWFETFAFEPGPFGEAEIVAKSKSIPVDRLANLGMVESKGGQMRLHRAADYAPVRLEKTPIQCAWQGLHLVLQAFLKGGNQPAAQVLRHAINYKNAIGGLVKVMYELCVRKGLTADAGHYRDLDQAYEDISLLVDTTGSGENMEMDLGD